MSTSILLRARTLVCEWCGDWFASDAADVFGEPEVCLRTDGTMACSDCAKWATR